MYSTSADCTRPTAVFGKLEGVTKVGNRVTPERIACQNIIAGETVSELTVDSIGHVGIGIGHSDPDESKDCSTTIAEGCKLEKSSTVGMEGWVEELTRVSSTHLPPGHPCLEYLKGHGFDLGTEDDVNRFTGNPSPLGGKRWYIAVSVKGKGAEFLVDTWDLVSEEHDNLKLRVNALTVAEYRLLDGLL